MHARRIVHLDFKSDQVLLLHGEEGSVPTVKIADLGLSKIIGKVLPRAAGCPGFVAPEVEAAEEVTVAASPAADAYALGMTAMDIASPEPLGNVSTNALSKERVEEGGGLYGQFPTEVMAECNGTCSPRYMQFAKTCLKKNPGERATVPYLISFVKAQLLPQVRTVLQSLSALDDNG